MVCNSVCGDVDDVFRDQSDPALLWSHRGNSQKSKYEIKGSKSRSVREKNVAYSNLKKRDFKGYIVKNGKKKTLKT